MVFLSDDIVSVLNCEGLSDLKEPWDLWILLYSLFSYGFDFQVKSLFGQLGTSGYQ